MDVRVYYEDTDAAGVVYHANYLRFLERGRTEFFRERGILVAEMALSGFVFPVVNLKISFISPARHDDLLCISTTPVSVSGASFALSQRISNKLDGKLLVDALVTLACVSPLQKARRIPVEVKQFLQAEIS